MISFEEFKKMELKVGTIKSVEQHPNANKLYVLRVDLGNEERQLVAGLKESYNPEDLEGKQIIVITNLKPAKLRGIESCGMLLAAEDSEGKVSILTVDRELSNGSLVH